MRSNPIRTVLVQQLNVHHTVLVRGRHAPQLSAADAQAGSAEIELPAQLGPIAGLGARQIGHLPVGLHFARHIPVLQNAFAPVAIGGERFDGRAGRADEPIVSVGCRRIAHIELFVRHLCVVQFEDEHLWTIIKIL